MFHNFTIQQIQEGLKNRQFTLSDVIQYYIDNATQFKHLNAFIELYEDEAKHRANEIQRKIESGTAGKLAGAVVSLKDNIVIKNKAATAGSKILENFVSTYNATCVQHLLNEDAIIIGRTNCDEFGMGSSTTNTIYGALKNNLDETKIAGGSSGGAAVSVAIRACNIALGSDTGGSVRQPAGFCNTYALKPTYGAISRYGLLAYASSFDVIGLLANSISDLQLVSSVLYKKDENDSTSVEFVPRMKKIKRVAYFNEIFTSNAVDENIKQIVRNEIEQLKKNGVEVQGIDFKYMPYVVPTYYVLTTAEASSNLSRYDGVRYGYSHRPAKDVQDLYIKSRTFGFGNEVKRRILLGTFVLSSGYYDAYYSKAQKVRRLIKNEVEEIFKIYDAIICPTSPVEAWSLDEKITDPTQIYLSDIFTVISNLAGVPTLVCPRLYTKNKSVGIQFISSLFNENELFTFVRN